MRVSWRLRALIWCVGLWSGCSDAEAPHVSAGNDAGPVDAGSPDGGRSEAGRAAAPPRAGQGAVSRPVSYEIPDEGGSLTVAGLSGVSVDFDFPAHSGVRGVAITPISASSLGWEEGQFSAVLALEPDGIPFAEPVRVRPSSRDVLVLSFPSAALAEGLELAADGGGFLLHHFATLAVVAPGRSCGDASGWKWSSQNASANRCQNPNYPRHITFACELDAFCLAIDASCCAPPGQATCLLQDDQLTLSYAERSACAHDQDAGTSPERGL